MKEILKTDTLTKLTDPTYIYVFASFFLFLDIALIHTGNLGILHSSFEWGDEIPIGFFTAVLILFGLFVAIGLPKIFYTCNAIYWEIYFRIIPTEGSPDDLDRKFFWDHQDDFLSLIELKSWAVKENNQVALNVVTEAESLRSKTANLRPKPFLLALLLSSNCLYSTCCITHNLGQFSGLDNNWIILTVISLVILYLFWFSFQSISEYPHYAYLKGVKKFTEEENKAE